MRTSALVLLCALLAPAGDGEDLPGRVRDLERRAEERLDAGDRAGAFALLAESAALREEARRGEARPTAADAAIAGLEAAAARGDAPAALAAAREARDALAAWRDALARREKALADVPRRLDELEREVRELAKLLR
jgi:hypothetical protein